MNHHDDEYNNFQNGISYGVSLLENCQNRRYPQQEQHHSIDHQHCSNRFNPSSFMMNTNHHYHQNHHHHQRRVFFNGVTKRRRPKALCFTPPSSSSSLSFASPLEGNTKRNDASYPFSSRRRRRPPPPPPPPPPPFTSNHSCSSSATTTNMLRIPSHCHDDLSHRPNNTSPIISTQQNLSRSSNHTNHTTTTSLMMTTTSLKKSQFHPLYVVPNAPPSTTPTTPMTPTTFSNTPTPPLSSFDTMAPHNNNDFIIDNYHHALVRHIHPKPELNQSVSSTTSQPSSLFSSQSDISTQTNSPFSPFSDFSEWNLDMSGSMFDIIVNSSDDNVSTRPFSNNSDGGSGGDSGGDTHMTSESSSEQMMDSSIHSSTTIRTVSSRVNPSNGTML
ncbi:hypothetical protein FDP41_003496 [Naegleria fowleri]|uniref:Uncharacterized protein n=1 Tax=Naegleria fowleri TaxID=5763 RepID=A0A6A5BTE6_NAEFO|nr:uncharacterized protein FDP41_003496 [Naegleria fowleri]KAF0977504.1 hypothetical protein FDP41_003496 [Naegleria fowleri]